MMMAILWGSGKAGARANAVGSKSNFIIFRVTRTLEARQAQEGWASIYFSSRPTKTVNQSSSNSLKKHASKASKSSMRFKKNINNGHEVFPFSR
jgi:hypothetical protein